LGLGRKQQTLTIIMLHVGELPKLLTFLGDQREKMAAWDQLFGSVVKDKEDGTDFFNGGTMFEDEKRQINTRREKARRLNEKKAKLAAEGINLTDDEVEALDLEERGASSIKSSNITDKNPAMKVINFSKDAGGVDGQKNGNGFAKEKVQLGAKDGESRCPVSGLAGLKSNNLVLKIFSNEGAFSLLERA